MQWQQSPILGPLILSVILLVGDARATSFAAQPLPNIVFILADDLGYGDSRIYNSEAKTATVNIDQLARQGIMFTDAHAAATCVPSRYQLMTGRYLFRSRRESLGQALIEPGRVTLASLLKRAGYSTAMIGKWHLGFEGLGVHPESFDYTKPLRGGPVDHGFDYYFGIHASLDVAPYFFIENDLMVEAPTATIEEHHTPGVRFMQGAFWRAGPIAADFKHEQVLPRFVERAVQYINSRARSRQPFFLYLALSAPHAPWVPIRQFRGQSDAGMYGDFVMQVDDAVGRVMTALDKAGKAGDTLLIFTSDNGPLWFETDIQEYDHRASGAWRGMKADAWEGGHRVPFVARWPGKIHSGKSSAQLISFTDMLSTFAAITAQNLPGSAGEDSLDMLPVLLGKTSERVRDAIIHEVIGPSVRSFAIRRGSWKLIPWLSDVSVLARTNNVVKVTPPGGQLYNLADDPGERRNVYAEHPQIVQQLTELLGRLRREGRSMPN